MNKNLQAVGLLATAVLTYTSCTTQDADKKQTSGSWDDASQASAGEDQEKEWGVQDYVARYDAGIVPPEEKQVFKDANGDKFVQIQVPKRIVDKSTDPSDTSLTTVFKQLDGKKTQEVTDSTKSHYHGSGAFIRWYPYYGSYYHGGGYNPAYQHAYSGYYTSLKTPVQNSSQRAANHNALLRGNAHSIVSSRSIGRNFRFNTRMMNNPSRSNGVRGTFGRSSFHGGGSHSFGS